MKMFKVRIVNYEKMDGKTTELNHGESFDNIDSMFRFLKKFLNMWRSVRVEITKGE